jgi:hypothetical protein
MMRRQPQRADSLFVRGVAKLRKGSAFEGEADQKAALALNARVADQIRRSGVDLGGSPAPR